MRESVARAGAAPTIRYGYWAAMSVQFASRVCASSVSFGEIGKLWGKVRAIAFTSAALQVPAFEVPIGGDH